MGDAVNRVGTRALVTGAAGFVGSHLVEALVEGGWDVVGIDTFSPYYDVAQKHSNAASLGNLANFELRREDLLDVDLDELLADVDVVFHQAGQPGVRASWDEFGSYVAANIDVTQRLLAAAARRRLQRFVLASSSSVYGDADVYPTSETTLPAPMSPYGVTKLSAEHLCGVYARNWSVPTVALRYFTVYGPRQRPDMAMHRLVEAAIDGTPFPLFGDGSQVRDFTYVADTVSANLVVADADLDPGSVFNVAGGGAHSMLDVISLIETLVGRPVILDRKGHQAGDVVRTGGSVDAIRAVTNWRARTTLEEGLSRQVDWHLQRRSRTRT